MRGRPGRPCGWLQWRHSRGKLGVTADGRLLSRMAHPVEWAASPLSPGPAASRGRRASLLAGPRAASRRLRHLRANAPPQPGPTTASTRGRRRARLVAPARARALSERGRRATGDWENPTAHRRARQSRSPAAPRPRARATDADPLLHVGWHSLQSVGAGPRPRPVHSAPRGGGGGSRAEGGATSHGGGAKAQASA